MPFNDSTFGVLSSTKNANTTRQSVALGVQTKTAKQKLVATTKPVNDQTVPNKKRKQGDENVNTTSSREDYALPMKKTSSRVLASSQAAENESYNSEAVHPHCRSSAHWDALQTQDHYSNNSDRKRPGENRVLRPRDQCFAPEEGEVRPFHSRPDRSSTGGNTRTNNFNKERDYNNARLWEAFFSDRKTLFTGAHSGGVNTVEKDEFASTADRDDPTSFGTSNRRGQFYQESNAQSNINTKASNWNKREQSPFNNTDKGVGKSEGENYRRNYWERNPDQDSQNNSWNSKGADERKRTMSRQSANRNKSRNGQELGFRRNYRGGRRRTNEPRNVEYRTGDYEYGTMGRHYDHNSKMMATRPSMEPSAGRNGSNQRVSDMLARNERENPHDGGSSKIQENNFGNRNDQLSLRYDRDSSRVQKATMQFAEMSVKHDMRNKAEGFEDYRSQQRSSLRTYTPHSDKQNANDARDVLHFRSQSSRACNDKPGQRARHHHHHHRYKHLKHAVNDLSNGAAPTNGSSQTERGASKRTSRNCDKSLFDIDALSKQRRSPNDHSKIVDLPTAHVLSVTDGGPTDVEVDKAAPEIRPPAHETTQSNKVPRDSWSLLNHVAAQQGMKLETRTRAGFTGRDADVFLFEFYIHIDNDVFSGSGSTLADARENCACRAFAFLRRSSHKREVAPSTRKGNVTKQLRRRYQVHPVSCSILRSAGISDYTMLSRNHKVATDLSKSLYSVLSQLKQRKCHCTGKTQNPTQHVLRAIRRLAWGFS